MTENTDRMPGELVRYTTSDGHSRVQCRFVNDTGPTARAKKWSRE
jgi:hypothetical protein